MSVESNTLPTIGKVVSKWAQSGVKETEWIKSLPELVKSLAAGKIKNHGGSLDFRQTCNLNQAQLKAKVVRDFKNHFPEVVSGGRIPSEVFDQIVIACDELFCNKLSKLFNTNTIRSIKTTPVLNPKTERIEKKHTAIAIDKDVSLKEEWMTLSIELSRMREQYNKLIKLAGDANHQDKINSLQKRMEKYDRALVFNEQEQHRQRDIRAEVLAAGYTIS